MPARCALLIGNSTFRHEELARLSAPANDVRELAALLENPAIGEFRTELKLDVGLVDARKAIKRLFEDRHPDDLVLFYYSGHGLLDARGRFYLAMTETDPADPDAGSIDETWLRGVFDESRSRRQVAILDCCHSGALIPGEPARKDASASPILTERTLDPSGHGRFIMAATTATTSAFEQEGRSLYTRHLVEGLKDGGAAPRSPEVTVFDLHAFVKRRVAETAPESMRPQLWQDARLNPDAQHLAIARNPRPRPKLPDEAITKLWSKDPEDVELASFRLMELAQPGAPLAEDARRVLAERLNAADTLTYTLGARIAGFIGAVASAPQAEATQRAVAAETQIASMAQDYAALAQRLEAEMAHAAEAAKAHDRSMETLKRRLDETAQAHPRERYHVALGSFLAAAVALFLLAGAWSSGLLRFGEAPSILRLEWERDDLAAQLAAQQEAAVKANADLQQVTEARDALSAQLAAQQAAAVKANADLQQVTEARDALSAQLAAQQAAAVKANADLQQVTEARDALSAQLAAQQEAAVKANADLQQVTEARDALSAQLAAQQEAAVKANADLRKMTGERDDLASRLKQQEEAAGSARDSLRQMTDQKDELTERLAEQEKAVASAEMREAQGLLATLGLYDGVNDGVLGLKTEAALLAFQLDSALPQSGRLDPATLAALRSAATGTSSVEPFRCTGRSVDICAEGSSFVEMGGLPEMIVIPAGKLKMGSPVTESGHSPDEGQPPEISIARFALARSEVTFDEWDACVADGGCDGHVPQDFGFGRGAHPVVDVSWDQARSYIDWLNSKVDGTPYRLPSEAEWEYAARALGQDAYPWGPNWDSSRANGKGVQSAAVGSYPANGFGVVDMIGNVSEWTEDCYRGDLRSKPADGSADIGEPGANCPKRVYRGGSWSDPHTLLLRSANRFETDADNRANNIGFRPARTLAP
jgi:formylglycine-generating enzyme required for sulfatase activity